MDSLGEFAENSRRALAAIVFTDVVGSSSLMSVNEERTLQLVHRDLSLIGSLCAKFHGKVLKSMGDGLLMYFESAVQAVACAQQVQNDLAEAAKTLPADQVLQHRIGIHLGDVFVSASDVRGDGVNVAARLQAEAEPNGICISQTVYDVVKNRLDVKATYLGPRDLKNIREAVPVYQILLEAQGVAIRKHRRYRLAWWQWLSVGTVAAVVMLGVVLTIIVLRDRQEENRPAGNVPLATIKPAATATSQGEAPPPPSTAERPPAPPSTAQSEKVSAARQTYLARMDFVGMQAWLQKNDMGNSPLYERYGKLAAFRRRMMVVLLVTNKDNALEVTLPDGKGKLEMYTSDGTLMDRDSSGERPTSFSKLDPVTLIQLARSAVQKAPVAGERTLELTRGADILHEECKAAGMLRDQPGK